MIILDEVHLRMVKSVEELVQEFHKKDLVQ